MSRETESSLASTIYIVIILLTACGLLLILHPLVDPDFGWHLRAGLEILSRREIPRQDWFSYTMPNFHWIDHEWLQDIIVASCFKALGFEGVRLWYGFLGVLFLLTVGWLSFREGTLTSVRAIGILPLAVLFYHNALNRAQIISLIGFALVIIILRKIRECSSNTTFLFLPLVFFLWANLHGGFPVGFALLFLTLFFEVLKVIIRRDRIPKFVTPLLSADPHLSAPKLKLLFGASFLSLLVTLINPYGLQLYEEVIRTLTDSHGRSQIIEWQSPLSSDLDLASILSLSLFALIPLLLFRGTALGLTSLGTITFFLAMALSARRHMAFFVVLIYVEIIWNINWPTKRTENLKFVEGTAAFLLFPIVAFQLFVGGFAQGQLPISLATKYPLELTTPENRTALTGKQIFHPYGWGGFLLLNLPEFRSFIDGRMLHWTKDGSRIFEEYNKVIGLKQEWQELLDRHKINLVILPKNVFPLEQGLRLLSDRWKISFEGKKEIAIERKN